MTPRPLILIVGGDALSERVYAELTATTGHDVRVVWPVSMHPDEALKAAGVADATSILTLSSDDELNLAVALRARMINRAIRVVLRQFNPLLGTKIEQNLTDCTAISPAAHSAATYAGAALDPSCFFALRFPFQEGALFGFVHTSAAELGAAGATVLQTEERLGVRVLAVGERLAPPGGAAIADGDAVVTFGRVAHRARPQRRTAAQTAPDGSRRRNVASKRSPRRSST